MITNLNIPASIQGPRLLSRRQIRQLIPASDMTLWRWERDGLFPRHVSINGRNYWLQAEVDEWLELRSQERHVDTAQANDAGDRYDR